MRRGHEIRSIAVVAAIAMLSACTGVDPLDVAPPADAPTHAQAATDSGLRLIAVRSGWVAVKEPHWRYRAPGFLVVPRIFLSRSWHEWLPNLAYAVVTPDGVVLVDTGAALDIAAPEYMACDPNSDFFYRRNLRFSVDPDEEVAGRLEGLGVPAADVDVIVISHFHADHSGRIDAFPNATTLTGPGNWPSHLGAVPCTLPPRFEPELASFPDGPFGVFERSQRLLGRADVRLVPLPGHTPGHVGVLVQDGDRYWLIAGDATFDRAETEAGHVAGVSQDVEQARETQSLILRQLEELDTVLLPAHDLTVLERLPASGSDPRAAPPSRGGAPG